MSQLVRCPWAETNDTMRAYHDTEWGRPLHDDRRHFEYLVLDSAQAGLSWNTILQKREQYRAAFDGFDWELVKDYDDAKVTALLANPGIVRNKLKITATIANARAFAQIRDDFGTFDNYIWAFVDDKPIQNEWADLGSIPATTILSDHVSKELKRRGFKFVGSTIIYAYMQGAGLVNDHLVTCPAWLQCKVPDGK
ncbi:MAG TPA: DNA-3-methyladenine glycosylase I [Candidatus Lokiarchaeia archaeon]|nr:DNA-3-methyladenine glycosylase I [Candidatus Lokiarchaeia archaeon]